MEPLPRFVPLDRTIAFGDGVFAVVIAVLVLGIETSSDTVLTGAALAVERTKLTRALRRQCLMLAARIRIGVRIYAAVMVLGVLVASLDVRAGTFVFILIPVAHFYNYLRDPFRSHFRGLISGEPK